MLYAALVIFLIVLLILMASRVLALFLGGPLWVIVLIVLLFLVLEGR